MALRTGTVRGALVAALLAALLPSAGGVALAEDETGVSNPKVAKADLAVGAAASSFADVSALETFPVPDGDGDVSSPTVLAAGAQAEGSVDYASDRDDVFAVAVPLGKQLGVLVEPVSGSGTIDALLYGPDYHGDFAVEIPVAGSATDYAVESFYYTPPVPLGHEGENTTLHVDVRASSGTTGYRISAVVRDVPTYTPTLTAGGLLHGSLSKWEGDGEAVQSVVYAFDVQAGQRLSAVLSGDPLTDFDVYVYAPGTTSFSGSGALAWSNLDSYLGEQVAYDVPAGAGGRYLVEVHAYAGSGDYTLGLTRFASPGPPAPDREAGPNRYETALALSRETFAAGSVKTAVLATGEDYPDALAASGLAGCYGSPVLLTPTDRLYGGVGREIQRLGATEVVIVGGSSAVAEGVERELKRSYGLFVDRIAGANRYETAAAVAREIRNARADAGLTFEHQAFVARGDDFADALAVAPFAYRNGFPVLLTRTGILPAETASVIRDLKIRDVVVPGGPTAVSTAVERAIDGISGVNKPVRLAGADRYETAVLVAKHGQRFYWGRPTFVGLTTGLRFPDALAGGAACGERGGVLLLTKPSVLPSAAYNYLKENRAEVAGIQVFGSDAAVDASIESAVVRALQ